MTIYRKKTRQIIVGGVKIGGGADISIQSMTNTKTCDSDRTVRQIKALEKAGCDIVRVAIKTLEDARAIKNIKKQIRIPIVADIHFNYLLAIESIKMGADKIRLNPGNIKKTEEVAAVIKASRAGRIPIRIGVNSGSVGLKGRRADLSSGLVDAALGYAKIFESMDFHDIIISLKASDVLSTVGAYRKISGLSNYPLHLGVTASGPSGMGIIKSSIGIGTLLLDGIGDTIRVSLTADPANEVLAAKDILRALHIRKFGPEIISCPTCGRCQVDLIKIVNELEKELSTVSFHLAAGRPLTIAVMGCEVNGPGEAAVADIGIAFGRDCGILFKKGKVLKKVNAKSAVRELISLLSSDS